MRPRLLSIVILAISGCGDDVGPSNESRLTDAIVFVSDRDGYRQLYRMGLDGSDITYLPQDGSLLAFDPDVSPDGRRIALSDEYGRVWVQGVDGSEANVVAGPTPICGQPRWSPDGTRLAMRCLESPSDDGDLYLVMVDGSGFVPLVTSDGEDTSPTWSPDGGRIAFATNRDGNWEIYVLDLGTGSDLQLTFTAEQDEFSPAWSPDGNLLAYDYDARGVAEPGSLMLHSLDSGAATPLLEGYQDGIFARWAPDGSSLVFAKRGVTDPGGQIVRVSVGTGEVTPLIAVDGFTDRDPTFTPASGWP